MTLRYNQRPSSLLDFVTYAGLENVKGLKGLDNLFSLLQTDVKKVLKKYNITEPSSKWKELQQLIEPYRKEWDSFAKSNICPLSVSQIQAIRYCRLYDDLSRMAQDTRHSSNAISTALDQSIKTLQYPNFVSDYFGKWKNYGNQNIYNREHFLNAPIGLYRSEMSIQLLSALQLGGNTMAEALKNLIVKDDIRRHGGNKLKGLGKSKVNELKRLLTKYNCIKLLNKR